MMALAKTAELGQILKIVSFQACLFDQLAPCSLDDRFTVRDRSTRQRPAGPASSRIFSCSGHTTVARSFMLPGFDTGAIFFRRLETLPGKVPQAIGRGPDSGATNAPAVALSDCRTGYDILPGGETKMKTRSPLEICFPLGIFALACASSLPTCIVAIAWMSVGVCCLGYRSLEDFPMEAIPRRWRYGRRGACVYFYHLAWWPWYMRHELRDRARRLKSLIFMRQRSDVANGSSGENDSSDQP